MEPNNRLAKWLTLTFSDECDIPGIYKPDSKKKKYKPDSKVQQTFDANLLGWLNVINVMQEHTDADQAHRFLTLKPYIEHGAKRLLDCQDFCDFFEIFIKRRDIDKCSDEELGKLSILLGAFQKEIENEFNEEPSIRIDETQVMLKSIAAQSLMEQGTIIIDGIEVNFWQGHNAGSVATQATWNKVKSYAKLNGNSTGENGSVLITGVLQIPRQEACEYATAMGFKVRSNISRKTDYIVMGSENVSPSKIAQALKLKEEGADIQFMDEIAFLTLLSGSVDEGGRSERAETT